MYYSIWAPQLSCQNGRIVIVVVICQTINTLTIQMHLNTFFGDYIYILNINNVHLATMLLYMYLLLKKNVKENRP